MRAGRLALVVAAVGSFGGLGIGPVQHYLEDDPAPSILVVRLVDDPAAAPRMPQWPAGVVDTADALPGGSLRLEPATTPFTWTEAGVGATDPLTITLDGPPRGPGLLGVGSVVTAADVAHLAALPEPTRTSVVGFLAEADGAALSVTAAGGVPTGEVVVVRRGSSGSERAALRSHPEVDELLRVWSQVRPELSAVIGTGAPGTDASNATDRSGLEAGVTGPTLDRGRGSDWADAVAQVVTGEILPAIDAGRVPLATALLGDRSPAGLVVVEDGEPRLTARGAAYAVAARVVQPGSRAVSARTLGPVQARAFARPGGGVSVLLWNPGKRRTVTVQVPDGERVLRFAVEVAPGALTGAVLGTR